MVQDVSLCTLEPGVEDWNQMREGGGERNCGKSLYEVRQAVS